MTTIVYDKRRPRQYIDSTCLSSPKTLELKYSDTEIPFVKCTLCQKHDSFSATGQTLKHQTELKTAASITTERVCPEK